MPIATLVVRSQPYFRLSSRFLLLHRKQLLPSEQKLCQILIYKAIRQAVVVAQLVEQLLPIPEVRGSNTVDGKIYIEHFLLSTFVGKTKIKKKWPGMAHLKNLVKHFKTENIKLKIN